MNQDWMPHPKKSLIEDIKGDCDQSKGIDESRQDSGAVVAKRFGRAGRAGLYENCDPREQKRQQISYVVAGFREQRQTVGADSGKKSDQHIRKSGGKRIAQGPGAQRCMWMRVRMGHKVQFTAERCWISSLSAV